MNVDKHSPIARPRGGFLSELRRRRVLHIGGIYIAGAWLGAEVLSFLLEQAGAPAWAFRLIAIVFVVGFPVTVVLAWIIQVRPDGSWAIDPSGGQRRTITGAIALGLLATAGLSWLILPRIEDTLPHYQPIPNSVAILPLAEPDSAPGVRSVAQTLYTALRDGLYQSQELVLIRLDLEDSPGNPVALGREYRIAALLTGSVLHDAGRIRVELKLLDVGQSVVGWSQTFDWDPTAIAETGTTIASGVLEAMGLPVLSRQKFAGTDDQEAYEAVLLGREHAATFLLEDVARAIEEFQRAIELDPGYVRAYTSLGSVLNVYKNLKGPSEAERRALDDRARQALETAVELDNQSAEAISALAWITPNREIRVQLLEHALELDPNHELSYHRLGWQRWGVGELEEAVRLFRKALELDPMDANQRHDLGDLLLALGWEDEAMVEIHKSMELEPGMALNHVLLGRVEHFEHGNLDKAMLHYRKAYSLDPELGDVAGLIAAAFAQLGARHEALAWMERAFELSPTRVRALLAGYFTHIILGEEDAAAEYAQGILELYPGNNYALSAVGERDIAAGQAEFALERWQEAYPHFFIDDPACDIFNLDAAVFFATNLVQAGRTGQAERLLHRCLPVAGQKRRNYGSHSEQSQIYALLERKEEALDAARREIIDRHNLGFIYVWARPEFDLLRDDPEFQRLMQIAKTDLAEQLERVREMERNGELAPAPGVEIQP
jgi:tetratricopeptide (TPR) repeat protein